MTADPRIDSYQWSGGREAMLRFGPDEGPVVVAALPLLEEANRTRAFVVTILRALAERGIGGVLPDLPGTGESLVPTEEMRLADLRDACAAAARAGGERVYGLGVRSGALLHADAHLRGRWYLSPQSSDDLVREWRRAVGRALDGDQVEMAGNKLSKALLNDLAITSALPGGSRGPAEDAELDPGVRRGGAVRVVRLETDPRPADLKIDGAPPWRRFEPENDPALAQQLVTDIADWIAACGG